MKKIVRKIIKSLIILTTLFSIVSTIIFINISSSNKPCKWVSHNNGKFEFAEKNYKKRISSTGITSQNLREI